MYLYKNRLPLSFTRGSKYPKHYGIYSLKMKFNDRIFKTVK